MISPPLAVSDAIVTGSAAVVGALVGATAGGAVDWLLDRTRERDRAKAGARLIGLDLALADGQLKQAEAEAEWWNFYELRMTFWLDYCDVLATRLDKEQFEAVSQAVSGLSRLGGQMTKRLAGDVLRPLSDSTVAKLRPLRLEAAAAYNALSHLADLDTVGELIHGEPDQPDP